MKRKSSFLIESDHQRYEDIGNGVPRNDTVDRTTEQERIHVQVCLDVVGRRADQPAYAAWRQRINRLLQDG
ncbi:MAG: hypothetical protein Kow0099_15860 [Candidatus Abyssubacteria bacterium]